VAKVNDDVSRIGAGGLGGAEDAPYVRDPPVA
jgi:hypothetical protein